MISKCLIDWQRSRLIFDTRTMKSWWLDLLSRERSQGCKGGADGQQGWPAAAGGRIPLGSYVCRETAATADHLLQLRLLRVGHPLRTWCSPHFHLNRLPTKMYTRHLHTLLAKNTDVIHFPRWKTSTMIQARLLTRR